MKILITGGFGFIGTHLTEHYLKNGHNVSVIDNLSTNISIQKSKLFLKHNNQYHFSNIDLGDTSPKDLNEIKTLIKGVDIIYHLASPVGVKYIDSNPHYLIIKGHGVNSTLFPIFEEFQKKVIFASSSEVYGESKDAKETDTLQIGSPDVLRWGYACNKLMSEFLIKSYSFPSVIIRPFNVTGRLQSLKSGMVLPSFIYKAKQGENLTVYNNGNQLRSFCDIRDAVKMITLLGESDAHNGKIYNIGSSSNSIKIQDLAKLVIKVLKVNVGIDNVLYSDVFSSHSRDIIERLPNTKKISSYYQCKYNLEDIILSMGNETQ